MAQTPQTKTLVIDNFNGRLTRFRDGDINSGKANYYSSYAFDTFGLSGTLSFNQAPYDITKSVITDLVMAAKNRVESGITYVYAIGHTGRLYKIQVNNLSTKNPDYDNPVLLGTLANGQTFLYGSSLDFYSGISEKIWIGHDQGVTKINFDGTGETMLSGAGWTTNVPRQSVQFVGSIFFTNGANLAQVDGTELLITGTKLSPGLPANMQARDLDVTSDGRYVVTTVTRNLIDSMISTTPDTNQIASMPSLLVYWNGTDSAATASTSFPSFSMTSYHTFSQYEYLFGYQIGGAQLGTKEKSIQVLEFNNPPFPNAGGSSGDFLGWGSTQYDVTTGKYKYVQYIYGTIDSDTPIGLYRQVLMSSSLTNGDIIRVPYLAPISSFAPGPLSSGYSVAPYHLYGTGKTYFSTLEYDGVTTKYGFYAFKNVQDYIASSTTGIYETQHQVFSKKVKPTEVRVYYEPTGTSSSLVSFTIDLIGIDGAILTGGSYTFSSSNQITSTSNTGSYPCTVGGTPVIGMRITNAGYITPFIHRVEIDYTTYGN